MYFNSEDYSTIYSFISDMVEFDLINLATNINPQTKTKHEEYLIHYAIKMHNSNLIKKILDDSNCRSTLDYCNYAGDTPLSLQIKFFNLDTYYYDINLLDRAEELGIDLSIQGLFKRNCTYLHVLAIYYNKGKASSNYVNKIISHYYHKYLNFYRENNTQQSIPQITEMIDNNGNSALSLAIDNSNENMIVALIEAGASIDTESVKESAKRKNYDIIKKSIEVLSVDKEDLEIIENSGIL